jgi:hypothetical protein
MTVTVLVTVFTSGWAAVVVVAGFLAVVTTGWTVLTTGWTVVTTGWTVVTAGATVTDAIVPTVGFGIDPVVACGTGPCVLAPVLLPAAVPEELAEPLPEPPETSDGSNPAAAVEVEEAVELELPPHPASVAAATVTAHVATANRRSGRALRPPWPDLEL